MAWGMAKKRAWMLGQGGTMVEEVAVAKVMVRMGSGGEVGVRGDRVMAEEEARECAVVEQEE